MLASAIVALAFNLRPVATSVGPVLEEVSAALTMSPFTAGVLTTMPVYIEDSLSPEQWAQAEPGSATSLCED